MLFKRYFLIVHIIKQKENRKSKITLELNKKKYKIKERKE